jgi:hypothetical protein
VVTPLAGSGPLYAGRAVLVHGSVLSLLPITPALTAIPLPPVHDLLSAAQP